MTKNKKKNHEQIHAERNKVPKAVLQEEFGNKQKRLRDQP